MKQAELNFDAVTFSKKLGQQAKADGMELAASNRHELLEMVRLALMRIALSRETREATADDGQAWLIQNGYKPSDLGPAAGSMFSRSDWVFTGKWSRSARVSNHASDLRVWRLK